MLVLALIAKSEFLLSPAPDASLRLTWTIRWLSYFEKALKPLDHGLDFFCEKA